VIHKLEKKNTRAGKVSGHAGEVGKMATLKCIARESALKNSQDLKE
jgi:hypothetical protein